MHDHMLKTSSKQSCLKHFKQDVITSLIYTGRSAAVSEERSFGMHGLLRRNLNLGQQTPGQLVITLRRWPAPQKHSPGLSSCLFASSFVVTSVQEQSH